MSGVYREVKVAVVLLGGSRREVMALTYVVERAHPSYAGRLPLTLQARLIRGARGVSGLNLDYLISTLNHLPPSCWHPRSATCCDCSPSSARTRRAVGRPITPILLVRAMLRATRRLPVSVPVRGLKLDARRRFLHRQTVLL